MSLQEQLDWKLPIVEKDLGVWVPRVVPTYVGTVRGPDDFETLKFIEYFKSVKLCRDKYNIPSSTFKRVRKHRLNCKGYLFSNYEL